MQSEEIELFSTKQVLQNWTHDQLKPYHQAAQTQKMIIKCLKISRS